MGGTDGPVASGPGPWRPPVDLPTAVLALAAAIFLSAVRPLTWPATAAVMLTGAMMLSHGLALSREERAPAPAPLPRAAVLAWWGVLLTFAVLEVVNNVLGSSYAHPTLSILLDPLTNSVPGRFAGVLAWVLLGDRLARR